MMLVIAMHIQNISHMGGIWKDIGKIECMNELGAIGGNGFEQMKIKIKLNKKKQMVKR